MPVTQHLHQRAAERAVRAVHRCDLDLVALRVTADQRTPGLLREPALRCVRHVLFVTERQVGCGVAQLADNPSRQFDAALRLLLVVAAHALGVEDRLHCFDEAERPPAQRPRLQPGRRTLHGQRQRGLRFGVREAVDVAAHAGGLLPWLEIGRGAHRAPRETVLIDRLEEHLRLRGHHETR